MRCPASESCHDSLFVPNIKSWVQYRVTQISLFLQGYLDLVSCIVKMALTFLAVSSSDLVMYLQRPYYFPWGFFFSLCFSPVLYSSSSLSGCLHTMNLHHFKGFSISRPINIIYTIVIHKIKDLKIKWETWNWHQKRDHTLWYIEDTLLNGYRFNTQGLSLYKCWKFQVLTLIMATNIISG